MELSFGAVDAMLARLHDISSDKRIAFQGRLKAFLRLGLIEGVRQGRGRAATYSAGDLTALALALELTQLGLPPERVVKLLSADMFPSFATVKRSVDALRARARGEAAEPVFLFLDPSALMALTAHDEIRVAMVSWSGAAHLATHLAPTTSSFNHRRLALINVTALIDAIAMFLPPSEAEDFLEGAERWARTGTLGFPDRDIIGPWEKI